MQNQIIQKIGKPVKENALPKLQSTYPNARVKGRVITTKPVGVSFENRQDVIARMQMGDRVWLDREPENPYDPNAIAVCRSNGEMVGFISRDLAACIAPYFDAYSYPIKGRVTALTGSQWDGYTLGLVINFKLPKPKRTNDNGHKTSFNDWDDDWEF